MGQNSVTKLLVVKLKRNFPKNIIHKVFNYQQNDGVVETVNCFLAGAKSMIIEKS
jgi:hypothetical protein